MFTLYYKFQLESTVPGSVFNLVNDQSMLR